MTQPDPAATAETENVGTLSADGSAPTPPPAMVQIRNRWTGAVIREAPADRYGRADLSDADLRGADLRGADLRGADLSDADLSDADLRGADLSDADLRGADLRDAVFSGAVLSDADLRGADLRDAVFSGVPVIPQIHQAVYAAASQPGALNMGSWHSCETTHCRAGWVITLAGKAGRDLEWRMGPGAAAALIYVASDRSLQRIPNFFATNDDALADMQRLAERESALQVAPQ
jgi:hypothetical protein